MRLLGFACVVASLLSQIPHSTRVLAGDGKLDAIRNEVDEQSTPSSPEDSESDSHSPPDSGKNGRSSCGDDSRGPAGTFHFGSPSFDECESTEQAVGWAILFGVTSPWWLPNMALEGDGAGRGEFPRGPYADGHDGYLVIDDESTTSKPWGGRLSLDTADNFDDVTTLTGRLRLDTVFRLGVDAEWSNLVEHERGRTDWLGRGDFNVVVRFAQSSRMQFHSGIGLNWLADQGDSDYGFNFTYGFDLFPVDPVVTSATLDLGTVGNSTLTHFRGTLGLRVRPQLHLYTGYDFISFEGTEIHSLLTGIEFWF